LLPGLGSAAHLVARICWQCLEHVLKDAALSSPGHLKSEFFGLAMSIAVSALFSGSPFRKAGAVLP